MDRLVHLNQLQVVGSHNSYHVLATQEERDLRRSFIGDEENSLEYGHDPLAVQFSARRCARSSSTCSPIPTAACTPIRSSGRSTNGGPAPAGDETSPA